MLSLPGYGHIEAIDQDAHSRVLRGVDLRDGRPVILKTTLIDTPDARALDRLRLEHAILVDLQDGPGVPRPRALLPHGATLVLVVEAFRGERLDLLLRAGPLPLGRFFEIAFGMLDALHHLHKRQVVLRDLRPRNVLVGERDAGLQLVEFGAASRLQREPSQPVPLDPYEDMLAYMSPEQTGRMNRSVDYRADYYALGATLCEMLTGEPPFSADDALELVHCHLARTPVAPRDRRPEIPAPLSAVVLKLLAKLAEDRYQSIAGLRSDLRRCQRAWLATGQVPPFALGAGDVSDRFQLTERLYGREAEVAALLASFDRVAGSGRPELVLVAGYSGVGKSRLVGELHKPVVARRGRFIEGKIDPYRRDMPHAVLAEALRALIQQLLSGTAAQLLEWRQRIIEVLGDNTQALVELVPQLHLVVGAQPPLPHLPADQAQHRLQRSVQQFVAVFARPEHPLVMFLDDLQWADAASIEVLSQLVGDPQTRSLLVIGAYRDNEVDARHPLNRLRTGLDLQSVPTATLTLAPLLREHITQALADTLHCDIGRAAELAQIVYAKTRGNPFFTYQFISALHHDRLIVFDHLNQTWVWQAQEMASRNFTDNVVELMLAELRRLPAATREAMALGGLLGNRFTRATLLMVGGPSLPDTEAALRPALEVGLLSRDATAYRFLHDRVHEAAYALTPAAARPAHHWRIGCRLLEGLAPDELDERTFDVADHLNRGMACAAGAEPALRNAGARLNLRAGAKAQTSTAYAAAIRHHIAGHEMLGESGRAADPALAFELQLGRARNAWLAGDMDAAHPLLEALMRDAPDDLAWADAAQVAIALRISRRDDDSACRLALACLRRLGLELPDRPSRTQVQRAYDLHRQLLGAQPIESLADLPRMTDKRHIAATRVLASIHSLTFFADRDLWALTLCTLMTLSQRHGLSDAAPRGIAAFGFAVSSYLRDTESAVRYGDLAARLLRQLGSSHDFPMVDYHRALIDSWARPLRDVLALERRALRGFIECGDRITACVCAHRVLMDAIRFGEPLAPLADVAEEYLLLARGAQYGHGIDTLLIRRQHIASLRGETRALGSFDGPGFAEADFLEHLGNKRSPTVACWYHVARLAALCVAGDDAAGFRAAREAEPLLDAINGLLSIHDYHCFDALCIAALIDGASGEERDALRARLRAHEACMLDFGTRVPATCGYSQLLVAAEAARVDADPLRAMGLYEQAVAAARSHACLPFEALANERAARFYSRAGITPVAESYLFAARTAYLRWGADAKVALIDAAHPRLARWREEAPDVDRVGQVDALAIVKAARAISGAMLPGPLLREMLTIVLQQAGAQFGALFLTRGDTLEVQATARGDGPRIEVSMHGTEGPAEAVPSWVPAGIASYVWRSGERVLIDDATVPNQFSGDAALSASRARSVLALPILRQAGVIGVMYLEHRAVARAFSLASVAVLEQLAAQAAISLESSRLYAELADQRSTLEAKVEARTQDLERSHATLQTMLDGMPALISLKGLDGRYLMHNRHYAEQLGHGDESLVGRRSSEVVGTEFAQRSRSQDLQIIASGRGISTEEDEAVVGGVRTFQVHKFPVRDARGAIHAIGSISIDITELKAARVEAEAAARAKSQFLANMSHEIRTPMNAILGMAHLALGSGLNTQQHNYVRKLEQSARALLGLINDILDFSKIEAGKLDLDAHGFQLTEVLDNLDGVIGMQAAEKKLELVFDIGPDVPDALVGDPLRLGQVLINLGNNAVKFTERGEVVVRVELLERGADNVLLGFSMRDTGMGMSEAQRSRLFHPFTQADPSTSRRYGGTGLGLAISSELVGLFGGTLSADSAPGQGSTFRFSARLGLQGSPAERPAAEPAAPPGPAAAPRVLVVDDNPTSRGTLLGLCHRQGWRAEAAEDGWDAMRRVTLAASDPFGLALVDWRMPGMDGVECARKLRGATSDSLPLVMLATPFDSDALTKRLAALGVAPNAVLAKPVLQAPFRDACAAALAGVAMDSRRPQSGAAGARRPAELAGVRVLLVEDNLINQELALELLREADMVVTVAVHGAEAIAALEREPFDLVLMDCQMPVLDGYAATHEIRKRPEWARLPIIALTANAMASDRRKALAAGMNDHIAKPIEVEAMFATLSRWAGASLPLPPQTPRPSPAPSLAPSPAPSLPPAPSRPASSAGTGPLVLPGVDIATGLSRTDGNEKLYRRLLLRFRDAQQGFVGAFRQARDRGDQAAATRLVHDLRAVAGTLGARAVERESQVLELACRENTADAAAYEVLLARVGAELDEVLSGLAAL